jgi:hypothetical protein
VSAPTTRPAHRTQPLPIHIRDQGHMVAIEDRLTTNLPVIALHAACDGDAAIKCR